MVHRFEILYFLFKTQTRKATGFKSLRGNYWEINQVTSKWQINISDKICKKGSKTVKVSITIEFYIFKLVLNFSFNKKFWLFWNKFTKKGYFRLKTKIKLHHSIFHIWISLGTKFHLKLPILNFWAKFAPKGYFQMKAKKLTLLLNSADSN